MSYLVPCPHCGQRDVGEFRFGGEKGNRPAATEIMTGSQWAHYVYDRKNVAGLQTEWWFHRSGCRQWFLATRHTVTNVVEKTWLPQAFL